MEWSYPHTLRRIVSTTRTLWFTNCHRLYKPHIPAHGYMLMHRVECEIGALTPYYLYSGFHGSTQ